MNNSLEIIEILADVVKKTSGDCTIRFIGEDGSVGEMPCPEIHYVFGNAQYVKDNLDELSRTTEGNEIKFPLIALFCPFIEQRNSPDYHTKAKVSLIIAYSSCEEWNNEYRLTTSFQNILRPIYSRFIESLMDDPRLDFGYDECVKHEYSENYSYGRYGAYTSTGDAVSEPIDAINIKNLEITVKNQNCRDYETA